MVNGPQLYTAKVMHKRLFPKENQFTYGVYYLALPLEQPNQTALPTPKGFNERDHGARDGSNLLQWAITLLANYDLAEMITQITLIAMPRIFGYAFNPVSFWLCFDSHQQLRAVLYEVNNTFGESHTYVCAHPDRRVISAEDWLVADKVFHVSPFLKREGQYLFRILYEGDRLGIWIDFVDAAANKQLITTISGKMQPLTRAAMRRAIWKHPLITLKVIALIHLQAMKLMRKGIVYIRKPAQLSPKHTATHGLTKK